jgi:cell division protein DivIC
MDLLSRIPSWLSNKYILASAFFVVWMLFFDHNDLFVQHSRNAELNDLLSRKDYYQGQIDQTRAELGQMRKSTASLERMAREKYMMKKDDEDLFLLNESKPATKP